MQLGGPDVYLVHGAALSAAGAVDDHNDAEVLQHSAVGGVYGERDQLGAGRSQNGVPCSGSACSSCSSGSPSTSWPRERKKGIRLFVKHTRRLQ